MFRSIISGSASQSSPRSAKSSFFKTQTPKSPKPNQAAFDDWDEAEDGIQMRVELWKGTILESAFWSGGRRHTCKLSDLVGVSLVELSDELAPTDWSKIVAALSVNRKCLTIPFAANSNEHLGALQNKLFFMHLRFSRPSRQEQRAVLARIIMRKDDDADPPPCNSCTPAATDTVTSAEQKPPRENSMALAKPSRAISRAASSKLQAQRGWAFCAGNSLAHQRDLSVDLTQTPPGDPSPRTPLVPHIPYSTPGTPKSPYTPGAASEPARTPSLTPRLAVAPPPASPLGDGRSDSRRWHTKGRGGNVDGAPETPKGEKGTEAERASTMKRASAAGAVRKVGATPRKALSLKIPDEVEIHEAELGPLSASTPKQSSGTGSGVRTPREKGTPRGVPLLSPLQRGVTMRDGETLTPRRKGAIGSQAKEADVVPHSSRKEGAASPGLASRSLGRTRTMGKGVREPADEGKSAAFADGDNLKQISTEASPSRVQIWVEVSEKSHLGRSRSARSTAEMGVRKSFGGTPKGGKEGLVFEIEESDAFTRSLSMKEKPSWAKTTKERPRARKKSTDKREDCAEMEQGPEDEDRGRGKAGRRKERDGSGRVGRSRRKSRTFECRGQEFTFSERSVEAAVGGRLRAWLQASVAVTGSPDGDSSLASQQAGTMDSAGAAARERDADDDSSGVSGSGVLTCEPVEFPLVLSTAEPQYTNEGGEGKNGLENGEKCSKQIMDVCHQEEDDKLAEVAHQEVHPVVGSVKQQPDERDSKLEMAAVVAGIFESYGAKSKGDGYEASQELSMDLSMQLARPTRSMASELPRHQHTERPKALVMGPPEPRVPLRERIGIPLSPIHTGKNGAALEGPTPRRNYARNASMAAGMDDSFAADGRTDHLERSKSQQTLQAARVSKSRDFRDLKDFSVRGSPGQPSPGSAWPARALAPIDWGGAKSLLALQPSLGRAKSGLPEGSQRQCPSASAWPARALSPIQWGAAKSPIGADRSPVSGDVGRDFGMSKSASKGKSGEFPHWGSRTPERVGKGTGGVTLGLEAPTVQASESGSQSQGGGDRGRPGRTTRKSRSAKVERAAVAAECTESSDLEAGRSEADLDPKQGGQVAARKGVLAAKRVLFRSRTSVKARKGELKTESSRIEKASAKGPSHLHAWVNSSKSK